MKGKSSLVYLSLVSLVVILLTPPAVFGDSPLAKDGPKELDPKTRPNLEEIMEPVTILSAITVYVNEPCDEEWRAIYPSNWMYWANYAVELADNKLYEWFGIDYYSVAQNVWYSSGRTAPELVDEARREIGLRSGSDIMIAFTGQYTGVGGYTWEFNQPYALVCYQGNAYDWIVARHESGHMYNQRHCSNNCIMNSYPYSYPNSICSPHKSSWYSNRYRY